MRLLFAHDHRFHRGRNGELYTAGTFPRSAWDRFLDHFDDVQVIARDGGMVPTGAQLARSDRERVSFEFLPSLASFKQLVFRSRALDVAMASAVEAADAVVARLPSEIGLLALKHARKLGKPYAVEVVGCAWDSYLSHGAPGARLYAPLAYLRARRAIARAPLALYVTCSWLQARYPTGGHQESASNVSLQLMDASAAQRRRDRLDALAAGRRPVLGTIGTLRVKYKGIHTALEALARLRGAGLDLTYRVLGAGAVEPWQRLADQLGITDLVHFEGTRSAGEEVSRWLDGIDIHLQPSFTEGLPRAMIEAMSRGAAGIGSTCGGIPELLPPERLHRPGDSAALAAIIRRLAADPAELVQAAEADQRMALRFDPEALSGRRRDFYGRLRDQVEQQRLSR
jgi:glycosyltransferase involved in cell wall biosynthesis